ncbi:hypothetical protein OH77DRAFT_296575 [Trametes cingulata]|nr:hypothetical protein OH77DRAFT_296575 [Trametes cingulata]
MGYLASCGCVFCMGLVAAGSGPVNDPSPAPRAYSTEISDSGRRSRLLCHFQRRWRPAFPSDSMTCKHGYLIRPPSHSRSHRSSLLSLRSRSHPSQPRSHHAYYSSWTCSGRARTSSAVVAFCIGTSGARARDQPLQGSSNSTMRKTRELILLSVAL